MKRIRIGNIDLYGCREALDRLDDYVDRELSAEEMAKVGFHLRICRHCAPKFSFESQFNEALRGKLAHLDVPETLKDKVAQGIRE